MGARGFLGELSDGVREELGGEANSDPQFARDDRGPGKAGDLIVNAGRMKGEAERFRAPFRAGSLANKGDQGHQRALVGNLLVLLQSIVGRVAKPGLVIIRFEPELVAVEPSFQVDREGVDGVFQGGRPQHRGTHRTHEAHAEVLADLIPERSLSRSCSAGIEEAIELKFGYFFYFIF